MKKTGLLLTLGLLSVFSMLSAQEGMFGYIDFNATLKLMPEYMEAQIDLQKTQSEYREEIERAKREFERQYIEFILEQDHLSPSIVAKRQKELQLVMDNNAQFRDQVQSDLEARREELLIPLKKKLLETIPKTGNGTFIRAASSAADCAGKITFTDYAAPASYCFG